MHWEAARCLDTEKRGGGGSARFSLRSVNTARAVNKRGSQVGLQYADAAALRGNPPVTGRVPPQPTEPQRPSPGRVPPKPPESLGRVPPESQGRVPPESRDLGVSAPLPHRQILLSLLCAV
ncbi:unnamed protein product [Arctogadus glacialis]